MRYLILVLLLAPLAAAQTPADAAGYAFPLRIEDPAGDHQGIGGAPNDGNPENDFLSFEATDDGSTLVVRITMAACELGVDSGGITITQQITGPNDEDWEATIETGNNCEVTGVGEDYSSGAGDPDTPIPGLSAVGVPDENAYYIFVDLAAAGLSVGDELTWTSVDTGRLVQLGASLTFPARDTFDISGTTYTLANAAVPPAPPEPTAFFEDADAFPLERTYAVEGNMSVQINWTTQQTAVEFDYNLTGSGSVAVSIQDAANRTLLANTLHAPSSSTQVFRNATAGVWNVTLQFVGFNGTLEFSFGEAPEIAPEETETQDPEPTGTDAPEESKTTSPNGTTEVQESPVPVAAVLLALGAVALRRRP